MLAHSSRCDWGWPWVVCLETSWLCKLILEDGVATVLGDVLQAWAWSFADVEQVEVTVMETCPKVGEEESTSRFLNVFNTYEYLLLDYLLNNLNGDRCDEFVSCDW